MYIVVVLVLLVAGVCGMYVTDHLNRKEAKKYNFRSSHQAGLSSNVVGLSRQQRYGRRK